MLGLLAVLVVMVTLPGLLGTTAHAAAAAPPKPTDLETSMMNSINTAWTLVAAFLVFGMQAGFVMLEAGFARKRETVNVLMECMLIPAFAVSYFMPLVMHSCLDGVTAS